jgi:DNA invertase Pin-like site-specific DNA recombinase
LAEENRNPSFLFRMEKATSSLKGFFRGRSKVQFWRKERERKKERKKEREREKREREREKKEKETERKKERERDKKREKVERVRDIILAAGNFFRSSNASRP